MKHLPRLTAKYFREFNEGVFGGALSDVKVNTTLRAQLTGNQKSGETKKSVATAIVFKPRDNLTV